jgi:hypothetical protein
MGKILRKTFVRFKLISYLRRNKKDMERFSMRQVIINKFGETEKNVKTSRSTKRSNDKIKDQGKYMVKIVDGVKYMVLK